jgi:hypothetical protein
VARPRRARPRPPWRACIVDSARCGRALRRVVDPERVLQEVRARAGYGLVPGTSMIDDRRIANISVAVFERCMIGNALGEVAAPAPPLPAAPPHLHEDVRLRRRRDGRNRAGDLEWEGEDPRAGAPVAERAERRVLYSRR